MNRLVFDKYAAPFIENGLMYEIYSCDSFAICNVANQVYAVFGFVSALGGPPGLLVTRSEVEKLVEDNKFLLTLLNMEKKELSMRSFSLDRKRYKAFEKRKQITDVNGPSTQIDYLMEERIINMKGSKKR